MRARVGTTPTVLTVLIAGAGLELGDGLTFTAMAIRSLTAPTVGQLGVLAALVLPRLVFAVLCVHTARRVAAADPGVPLAAVGLLALLSIQGATGLFLLWGAGATATGRFVLAGVPAVTAVMAAAAYWPARVPLRGRRDRSGNHVG